MKVKEESEKAGLKFNISKTKIMVSGPITSWKINGETMETLTDFIFPGLQNHCRWWLQPWNWKTLWKKSYDQNLDSILKSRNTTLLTKVQLVQVMVSNSHIWMWELDHKESWALKNWCFWTVVLETTLESPLDCKEILQGDPISPS